jgi:ribonuclease HII
LAQVEDRIVAGIDEAGRGPLAGPVVAAAVILDPEQPIEGIRDSKKLTERKRDALYGEILGRARAVNVGIAGRNEIDEQNILQATIGAMQRALDGLSVTPDHLMIDGQHILLTHPSQETVVRGDSKVESISAASIIAKVVRDRLMREYDKVYPVYGFAKHKGYGTKAHFEALRSAGACPIHRQSFKPVADFLPRWRDIQDKHLLGRLGEQLAAGFLIDRGYSIVDLNYKLAHIGELDIIAHDSDELVILEVKSLTVGANYEPEVQIDTDKRDRIMATANCYCEEKGIDTTVRFDVISVKYSKAGPIINHIKNGIHAD